MTEIEVRPDAPIAAFEDPTGGRLVAWASAAQAAHLLATSLVRTTFAPAHFKDKAGDATAAILAGDELGLSPIASLRAFYVIHGTPALYARSMVALVQSQGHQVWTESSSPEEVVVCGQRKGSEHVERAVWSMQRAVKAKYTTNSKYQTNPEEMLWAKAASEISRKIASDVLAGVPYSVEELQLEEPTLVTRLPRGVQVADPSIVAELEAVVDNAADETWPEDAT